MLYSDKVGDKHGADMNMVVYKVEDIVMIAMVVVDKTVDWDKDVHKAVNWDKAVHKAVDWDKAVRKAVDWDKDVDWDKAVHKDKGKIDIMVLVCDNRQVF